MIPEGCSDYDAVRSDAELARRCTEWYNERDVNWTGMLNDVPWTSVGMKLLELGMLFLPLPPLPL